MDGAQLLLVVIAAIVVTAVAHRRGLQTPLILVVVGTAVSFIPGLPRFEIEPELILSFVLPPLLYSTALEFSLIHFLRNLRPILGLGILLVVATTLVVGGAANIMVNELTLGAALVLGAVVAPPDAVSAVAIGRRLGLSKRVMTILTGESLVNDAAALTLFTITTVAVTQQTAFIESPVLFFGYGAVVGLLVGLVLAVIVLRTRSRLNNAGLETVLGIVVPFAAYLIAEELHASGVVAVVAAGFLIGHNADRTGVATRMQERDVWRTVSVLLEAFVFAYMGLQVKFVLDDVVAEGRPIGGVLLAALGVLLVVILVRVAWVLLDHARLVGQARLGRWFLRDRPNARKAIKRARHREGQLPPEQRVLPLKSDLVISWTGMRGVVTLAAAAGIPAVTASGAEFPGRATIQVIALVVAIGTLLIQGATLPAFIRSLKLDPAADEAYTAQQHRHAQQVILRAGQDTMRELFARLAEQKGSGVDPAAVEAFAARFAEAQRARQRVVDDLEPAEADGELDGRHDAKRQLMAEQFQQARLEMVRAQRRALTAERDAFRLDDDVYRELIEQLDLDEASVTARLSSRLQ
ncbi:cation:proton antiporter [Microlunatus parietis]|uniref:CPA1 family monovalent cation:H+ antiporter n=1 Tax=Microlunatus parietis TaxID=682979 RepID=A0A7Y9LG79_9ACTN|nr:sodium:proton antiporter [Microlunatus parietis]NYE75583.1 CPA1 family monovalent cation:H+ antiporter [Microlunatus parietis]